MRVASAHSAASSRTSQQSPLLSVDDVYKLAERTRMRTTLEARHLVVCGTQKLVRRDSGLSRPETTSTNHESSQQDEGVGTRDAEQQTDRESPESGGASQAPGFISDVTISIKPRTAPINSYSSFIAAYSSNDRPSPRLSRARTFVSSSLPVMSPRVPAAESKAPSSACQCYDITGPGICLECRKLGAQSTVSDRLLACFPPSTISERHVTTSALVRRVLPGMTQAEIQEKLANGCIARNSLIFPRRRHSNDDDVSNKGGAIDPKLTDDHDDVLHKSEDRSPRTGSDPADTTQEKTTPRTDKTTPRTETDPADTKPEKTSSKTGSRSSTSTPSSIALLARLKLQFRGEATTPLYFMDLKHMNSKIYHGRIGRTLSLAGEKDVGQGERRRSWKSETAALWPTYISPRKVKLLEEPTYRAYFAPPLLAKRKQMVCQHTGKPFTLHHISRTLHWRVLPDECLKAYA